MPVQLEQTWDPKVANFPTGHWMQPEASGTLPGSQWEQLEAPLFELNFPASQSIHMLTPPTEYFPWAQGMHSWV